MKRKLLSYSIRKFVRKEKARIRREVLDFKEQNSQIDKLYKRFMKTKEDKGHSSN